MGLGLGHHNSGEKRTNPQKLRNRSGPGVTTTPRTMPYPSEPGLMGNHGLATARSSGGEKILAAARGIEVAGVSGDLVAQRGSVVGRMCFVDGRVAWVLSLIHI